MNVTDFKSFIEYCTKHIKGDEKSESQLFLDHFFKALGYPDGLKGAGAECEFRIKDEKKGSTKFADLVWKPRVLIEMKKSGSNLSVHYQQAFDYWTKLVPDRPQYVILCNFNEFWIYDLNVQVYDPLEKILLLDLDNRKEALSFLFPRPTKPVFNYNREDVTAKAAKWIAEVYKAMTSKKIRQNPIEPEIALKYCLQMVLCMFAEDVNLLPNNIFTRLIKDLINEPGEAGQIVPKSYDVISGLFKEMNTQGITPGGIYKGVDYFNGGLFEKIYSVELTKHEIGLIDMAASFNWKNVNPAIFGSIFEFALDTEEQHKLGAHYTYEIDIKKIVSPVIVQPWLEKIYNAHTIDEYYQLLTDLSQFKVLDPSCGSGNFLFIAYKEMKLLESTILDLIRQNANDKDLKRLFKFLQNYKFVTTDQFYGLDIKPFAVELAKVTLMIAKELTLLDKKKEDFENKNKPLPLDNLDQNIICTDALFEPDGTQKQWPEADAIIGNPPYQSKNKMQKEFGVEYINKLREIYPDVPGRADFCVYWFYKAHKHLKNNSFAGLVGTNTIRQNYSREGSLDYIVNNGGTIIDAVSSQDWSGEAAVYVSIVNWKKGDFSGKKSLWFYDEKNNPEKHVVDYINSSLSLNTDVTRAYALNCNKTPKRVFQGQTHGHEGFLIEKKQAIALLAKNPEYAEVLKPFLIGDELLSNIKSQPDRFVIDFTGKDIVEVSKYKHLLKQIEDKVLPSIREKAELEKTGISKSNGREAWLNSWWLMWRRREDMLASKNQLSRFITCARVTKRPIFEFISSKINPNDALMFFSFQDDYSFGIIGSQIHWQWFKEKCSTLKGDWRYTTESVWDTFPWPQNPQKKHIEKVAKAAVEFRLARNSYMTKEKMSLRDLYRIMEKPGKNILKDLQTELDKAVIEAYGFNKNEDILTQLLQLNIEIYKKEEENEFVQAPGIPVSYTEIKNLMTNDCVEFDEKIK